MHGRGYYLFNSSDEKNQNSLFYAGEFKEGIADGSGKMVFKDGTKYTGTLVHGVLHSQNANIDYSNGDNYKGVII